MGRGHLLCAHQRNALPPGSARASGWSCEGLPLTPGLAPKLGGPGVTHGSSPHGLLLLSPRCSTASTLSVRSSRAARRRRAVRNQAQETATQPVSSSTPMPCGPPMAARCPPAQATPTHPTGSISRGDSSAARRHWPPPWVEVFADHLHLPTCSPHSQGGADPVHPGTWNRFSPRTERVCFVLLDLFISGFGLHQVPPLNPCLCVPQPGEQKEVR